MAKIIGLEQQQEALQNIRSGVKEVEKTNKFLETDNPSGKYTIFFNDSSGSRVVSTIVCEDKNVVDQLVRTSKENMAKQLNNLAEENRIELDPAEKSVLGL